MKKTFILLFALAFHLAVFSHPWKPSHYVIIDTDGGIDDLRAVSMLLASPDVRVLAITVSPGALNPENAYIKVRSLLNAYWHNGIPVGVNRKSKFRSPDFPVALKIKWGDEAGLSEKTAPEGITVINEILSGNEKDISFICLGSMSTASLALNEIPAFSKKVKEIIWTSGNVAFKNGFNYNIDTAASENIFNGDIPVRIAGSLGEMTFYNESLLKGISEVQTVYASKLSEFFRMEDAKNHRYSYTGNDEMAVLFLHYPLLFQNDNSVTNYLSPINSDEIRENTLKILSGETVSKNQVFRDLPSDPSFYYDDIRPYVSEIITRYGKDEFVSGVIANELHRHLGVFAIIGVKMGIRAREYFNTGVDEFRTISYAGSTPPLSCMNDGIQVSTGSTPGHGLLTVLNDNPAIPSAEFTYRNVKLRLTLKPEIAKLISSELKEINFIHGLDSNIYWEMVRKNSIKYWLKLDRHEIFDAEEVK